MRHLNFNNARRELKKIAECTEIDHFSGLCVRLSVGEADSAASVGTEQNEVI